MARALGAPPLAAAPSHFQRAVGLFEVAALPGGDTLRVGAPLRVGPALTWRIAHLSGTAPLLFLKPSERGVCQFAAPHARSPGGAFREGGGGGRRRGGADGLACTLGPVGMPLACSLYPLGAFFRAARSGVQFFSVDAPGCEGVRPAAAAAAAAAAPGGACGDAPASVTAYLSRAGVPPARLAAAEWWQRLATAWAASGVERAAAAISPRAAALRARARGGGRAPQWVEAAEAEAAAAAAAAPAGGAPLQAIGGDAPPGPILKHLRGEVARVWFSADGVGGCWEEWGEGNERSVEEGTAALLEEARRVLM
jgi:hypothetical protein